jgi:hypothetical protein
MRHWKSSPQMRHLMVPVSVLRSILTSQASSCAQ